jgi:hypothetical protein
MSHIGQSSSHEQINPGCTSIGTGDGCRTETLLVHTNRLASFPRGAGIDALRSSLMVKFGSSQVTAS